MPAPLRFEPLSPHWFPIGGGPFRARGLAFMGALRYVEKHFPGGREAFRTAIGPRDPWASFYDQMFIVTGDYDISPLLHLYVTCARHEGVFVGRFIEERARRSAENESKGVWKPMLKASSPEDAAARTAFAFNRYFPPCEAKPMVAEPGRFSAELSRLAAPMTGLYACSTEGFVTAALERAGATRVHTEWERPVAEGQLADVPIERVRFTMTW